MAELNLAERSSLEVGRDREGVYMWRVKVYFPDTNDLNGMVAVIDRMLACKAYVQSRLGKPPASGVVRSTEPGRAGYERTDDVWSRIEKAAKRLVDLDMEVGRVENLVNIMEQRFKRMETVGMSKPEAPKAAEGEETDDTKTVDIPISKPEDEKEA